MTTFFGILTKVGEAKEANAKALGVPVRITEMEVGDGGGVTPTPNRDQSALIASKRRAPINRSFVDPNNPSWLVIEQVIPEQTGGWWIRELGLRDADGDLVAVSNCPPTYKPLLAEGSARTQVVRMVLQVSSATNFELKIDPAVVLATRGFVAEEVAKRLGKDDTAVAAVKLATSRKFSISGAAKAVEKAFNGTEDVELVLTDLDMDKATAGKLAVKHGGTGVNSIAGGQMLVGNNEGSFSKMTPEEVRLLLGAPRVVPWASLPTENIGPVIVAEFGEVWTWAPAPFSGYRSPNCGAIDFFDSATPPIGYLRANFAAVSRTTYRGIFSMVGTRHGAGDGANTFNLPDMRGEFARGWDDARGVDGGREIGTSQKATSMYFAPNSTIINGAASNQAQDVDSSGPGGSPSVTYTTGGGTPASVFTVRPRNVALLACIKI